MINIDDLLFKTRFTFLLSFLLIGQWSFSQKKEIDLSKKINGINYVSPKTLEEYGQMNSVKRIGASWLSINPFAFISPSDLTIVNDGPDNWHGDSSEGIDMLIDEARSLDLKILLKPHFILDDYSWVGDFNPRQNESDDNNMEKWEAVYTQYILDLSVMAESHNIEMFCIGTEFKFLVTERPHFWKGLIQSIREIYSGQLTYAANWDNYESIAFWEDLDFIGVDAYFPISNKTMPTVDELKEHWQPIVKKLGRYSDRMDKEVIFTEYGYRSTEGATWEQWKIESLPADEKVNLEEQNIAYKALFESIWHYNWFAGGFIWKWWPDDKQAGGMNHSDYSPQHKPVEKTIVTYYRN